MRRLLLRESELALYPTKQPTNVSHALQTSMSTVGWKRAIKIVMSQNHDPKSTHKEEYVLRSVVEGYETAEKLLIYKYSPNYNTKNIYDKPRLPFKVITLKHLGDRHRLRPKDVAPEDYE